MKTTCLINNYNYADFVGEAVASALGQTVPFDEVVVVDDGSTDGSIEKLRGQFGDVEAFRIVAKSNGGQLSALNAGAEACAGDIVFFLDADDVYELNYVERVLQTYAEDPERSFVYCAFQMTGDESGPGFIADGSTSHDLGYSVLATLGMNNWVRAPTSCLSMRRWVLNQILPLPFERYWRTRADECLVFGASIVGARKYYLAESLVKYRVHGGNLWYGRKDLPAQAYDRLMATHRMFQWLAGRMDYDVRALARYAHWEFATIGKPTYGQLKAYRRLCFRADAPLVKRLRMVASLYKRYLQQRRAGGA